MIRILSCAVALAACPLAAQPAANDAPPLRSGSKVRLILEADAEAAGILVSAEGDTLRIVSPQLGLAQVPVDEVQRLDVAAASRRDLWKYPVMILGTAAGAGAGALASGDEFFPAFMNATIALTLVGGAVYALEGPPQRDRTVDVSSGLPGEGVQPGPGALVRISTPSESRAVRRLTDFSADSLYLVAEGRLAPVPRAEVTAMQVSLGPDRRRGSRTGLRIGAIGGGLLAGLGSASRGDWGLVLSPLAATLGALFGGSAGSMIGLVLAPPAWSEVPGFEGHPGAPIRGGASP